MMPVWASAGTDAAALRERIDEILARARPDLAPAAQEGLAIDLLQTLFALRLAGAEPPAGTAERVADLDLGLVAFVHSNRDRLLQEFHFGDQWLEALERRSALEFLLELGLPSGLAAELDPGELDDHLRRRGEVEGFLDADERPAGIPASHWWWFL